MKLGDKGSNFKYRIIMKYQVTAWVTAEDIEDYVTCITATSISCENSEPKYINKVLY